MTWSYRPLPVLTDPKIVLVVELADGLEDVPYQVSVTDLVSGYSDPEAPSYLSPI